MSDKHYCTNCGAPLDPHWERLSPGLVKALMKFGRAVWEQRNYKLHITNDLSDPALKLTHVELSNFQKLRFHGLIAKDEDENGRRERDGYWILTTRGNLFLKNKLAVPYRVHVNRNRVLHDHEPQRKVTIADFRGKVPNFDRQFEYEIINGQVVADRPVQPTMTNQGRLL